MEQITYTNKRGQSVVLGDSAPYILTKLEGAGAVQADIQTQKAPYQDGVTHINTLLEPRSLSIELTVLGADEAETYARRRKLVQVLNPKLGAGVLRYEVGGIVREIEAVPELAPVFPPDRVHGDVMQPGLLQLLCPSPFWMEAYTESEEIVTWIGGLRFPWRLPSRFAMKGPKIINIVNQGDVETPVRIEFRGPATNPRVTNQTSGEYIQVNRELLHGDLLVIATDFGAKRVEINGQNVFNWIDLGSTFWQLQVGDNVIEYSSDDPVEAATVSISYRTRYVGI
ncbi:MAG TPA: phage tail family protein [Pseudomonadaceae bacterium]|nr:phage tail family protein [Pseudomonadaceae bacterium]